MEEYMKFTELLEFYDALEDKEGLNKVLKMFQVDDLVMMLESYLFSEEERYCLEVLLKDKYQNVLDEFARCVNRNPSAEVLSYALHRIADNTMSVDAPFVHKGVNCYVKACCRSKAIRKYGSYVYDDEFKSALVDKLQGKIPYILGRESDGEGRKKLAYTIVRHAAYDYVKKLQKEYIKRLKTLQTTRPSEDELEGGWTLDSFRDILLTFKPQERHLLLHRWAGVTLTDYANGNFNEVRGKKKERRNTLEERGFFNIEMEPIYGKSVSAIQRKEKKLEKEFNERVKSYEL